MLQNTKFATNFNQLYQDQTPITRIIIDRLCYWIDDFMGIMLIHTDDFTVIMIDS